MNRLFKENLNYTFRNDDLINENNDFNFKFANSFSLNEDSSDFNSSPQINSMDGSYRQKSESFNESLLIETSTSKKISNICCHDSYSPEISIKYLNYLRSLSFVKKLSDKFINEITKPVTLDLTCQLSGVVNSIEWFKDCQLLVTIFPNQAYYQTGPYQIAANYDPSNGECSLSIPNNIFSSFDFGGTYLCVAKNSEKSVRCYCNVFVDCLESDQTDSNEDVQIKLNTSLNDSNVEEEDDDVSCDLASVSKPFPGESFKTDFTLEDEIGKGKFGIVQRCLFKENNQRFAAKFIKMRPSNRKLVQEEFDIMKFLKHKRLISLFRVYESFNQMIIVMQLVTGGELFLKLTEDEYISERDVIFYMKQVVEGVSYIHEQSIVHLDLKPENIMLVRPGSRNIKLIDFGLARRISSLNECKVLAGTAEFIAPEVVNYENISTATDMWSIGVITYLLLTGVSPFVGETQQETLANVTSAKWSFYNQSIDPNCISQWANDFISKLLIKDPKKRMSSKDAIDHQWFKVKPTGIPNIATERLKLYTIHRKYQRQLSNVRSSNFIKLIINGVYNRKNIEINNPIINSSRSNSLYLYSDISANENNNLSSTFKSKSIQTLPLNKNCLLKSSSLSISYNDLECTGTKQDSICNFHDNKLISPSPCPFFIYKNNLSVWKEVRDFIDDPCSTAPISIGNCVTEINCLFDTHVSIPFKFKYPNQTNTNFPSNSSEYLPKISFLFDGKHLEKCKYFNDYKLISSKLNDQPNDSLFVYYFVCLNISNVRYHHTGKYTIRIENNHGTLVHCIRLLVCGPPAASSKPNWSYFSSNNSSMIEIYWRARFNGNSPIVGYTVQFKKNNVSELEWMNFAQKITDTRLEISDLEPNIIYCFRVITYNELGSSPPSDYVLVCCSRGSNSDDSSANITPPDYSVTEQQSKLQLFRKTSRRISMLHRLNSFDGCSLYCSNPLFFYSIGSEIARGKYSALFSSKSLNQRDPLDYVMKIIRYDDNKLESVKSEHHILSTLKHGNIVKLKESFLVRKYFVLILYRCPGMSLLEYMAITGPIESKLSYIIKQLCLGLKYMHEQSYIHLDIKPSNLLVCSQNDRLSIVDFGSAQRLVDSRTKCSLKEIPSEVNDWLAFLAPEVIFQSKAHLNTDMWSVGVVTYLCIFGIYPFKNDNDHELHSSIISADFCFPPDLPINLSDGAKSFIRKLLVVDPINRISSLEAVRHEWILNSLNRNMESSKLSNKVNTKMRMLSTRSRYLELNEQLKKQESTNSIKASFVLRSFEEPPFDSPNNSSDESVEF